MIVSVSSEAVLTCLLSKSQEGFDHILIVWAGRSGSFLFTHNIGHFFPIARTFRFYIKGAKMYYFDKFTSPATLVTELN